MKHVPKNGTGRSQNWNEIAHFRCGHVPKMGTSLLTIYYRQRQPGETITRASHTGGAE